MGKNMKDNHRIGSGPGTAVPKKSRLKGFLARLTGAEALAEEKARLEAFLNGVPSSWCGWAADGTVIWHEDFCRLLGLQKITALTDIQNVLSPSDAAVLEGMFTSLQEKREPFSISVRTADGAHSLKLTGKAGQDQTGGQRFDILWLEDTTPQHQVRRQIEDARVSAEEERDRLQAALNHLPQPLWMRNVKTEIIWCNRAYAHMLDTSPATVVAEQKELSFRAARKGAATMSGKALAQAALDTGRTEMAQAYVIAEGNRCLMTIMEIPVPAAGVTLGVAQDITREEELEAEKKRYTAANKELLEQLGTAIGIFDGEQKLEFYNSAFAQLWGLEDKYLNTHPKLGDLMEKLRETRRLPEQADFRKYKQGWLNMFTGLLGPHEDMLYLPNGSALRRLVVPHPMGGLMMTFEDVTSRLELESSYNTLIAVQKETLDNLAEGVVVFGGDGRLRLWNPAFARLWGLNPEDLEGGPHVTRLTEKMKTRFTPDEWPRWQKLLVAQSIDRSIQEGRMTRSDGSLIEYSTVPLPDGGVLITHVDTTDSARVENALREKNAALETAERLKLDFLANVSYQLRTPLNAIMGFAEILSNEYFGTLNDRQKEYATGMREAGERLLHLIDDILDLSTIEAGYMDINKDEVFVADILDRIGDLTRDWARKEKIEVRADYAKNLGHIVADEQRLKQVLLNLVRNAIAHTPPGGVITLGAKRAGESVMLTVSDTGAGIAQKDQERVFQPFERAHQGTGKNRGAGLGLTLVRNIVEMHGGSVLLDSDEGTGATFTITLPVGTQAQQKKAKA